MIREIRYKISEDTKSIEPKTRQWAGMQYEDNATEVVFDISALGITNALCRIDFNSVTAGYFPSENLTPDSMPSVRRGIPKYLTQYGGELEAVAVKSASKKEVGFPSAELMGSESNTAPINIAIKKLNNIICVVDTRSRCFFILS